jgi:anaphase-promoting complex subunit 8
MVWYFYSVYYYRKAASIRPHDARMWCALGGCYEKLGKSGEAIGCFKRAVENQDREGILSYHLGRIFALRNEQHEAAKYYFFIWVLEKMLILIMLTVFVLCA